MSSLPLIDIIGFWLGIFLTFAILSFLYKDNPVYKLAEHLFIGVSIGYVVTKQFYDTLDPKLIANLVNNNWHYLLPLALSLMLLTKAVSKRWSWLARYPIAFVVAFYAGLQVNGALQGDFGPQLQAGMRSVVVDKVDLNTATADQLNLLPGFSPGVTAQVLERRAVQPFGNIDELFALEDLSELQRRDLLAARRGPFSGNLAGLDAQVTLDGGGVYWFGSFSRLIMLLGLLASLVYFYFSAAHTGAVGKVSRFGVWILMMGFGAAFGATVQGRLALAIGRAMDVLGRDKDPIVADQIGGAVAALISVVLIVGFIVAWELKLKRNSAEAQSSSD